MTRKQQKLIKAVVKNPDATLAELGQQSDYHDRANVHRALKSPNVRARISEMMEANPRLKRSSLLDKLAEGLEAKTTEVFRSKDGWSETREIEDMPTRKGYLELALRLNGDLDPKRSVEQPSTQILMGVVAVDGNEGQSRSIAAKAEAASEDRPQPKEAKNEN